MKYNPFFFLPYDGQHAFAGYGTPQMSSMGLQVNPHPPYWHEPFLTTTSTFYIDEQGRAYLPWAPGSFIPWAYALNRQLGPKFVPKPSDIMKKLAQPPTVVALETMEAKWKELNGQPGAAVSDLEVINKGYRRRYQNGAIYAKRGTGPAYWVHGDIGRRYDELGGPNSWLGFPTSDEIPLRYDNGRVSTFEHGEIYWWPDTGAIEMDEIILSYKGINCFGETDLDDFLGAGSDEIYATISVVAPTGDKGNPLEITNTLTRLYLDVDGGESFPDYVELYRGKPYGLNITFVLFEHDKGDPNAYLKAVESSVNAAAAGISAGVGAVAGPLVAGIATPLIQGLVPVVAQEINNLLGAADDLLGQATIPLTLKQVVTMAARTPDSTERQILYKIATPLLTGEGSSYKGYFSLGLP